MALADPAIQLKPEFPVDMLDRNNFTALFEGQGAKYRLEPSPDLDPFLRSDEPFLGVMPWSDLLRAADLEDVDLLNLLVVDEIRDAPDGAWVGWVVIAANDVPRSPETAALEIASYDLFDAGLPRFESFSMYFWFPDRPVIWRKDFTYSYGRSWADTRVYGLSGDEKWMRMTPTTEFPVWVRMMDIGGKDFYSFGGWKLQSLLARSKEFRAVEDTLVIRAAPSEASEVLIEVASDDGDPLRGVRTTGWVDGEWIKVNYTVLPEEYRAVPCPIRQVEWDERTEAVAIERITGWVRFRKGQAALLVPDHNGCT